MTTHVLLVEDSKFLKIAGERMLTKAGFSVTTAQDGEEALRRGQESKPASRVPEVLSFLHTHPPTASVEHDLEKLTHLIQQLNRALYEEYRRNPMQMGIAIGD